VTMSVYACALSEELEEVSTASGVTSNTGHYLNYVVSNLDGQITNVGRYHN
jgi:hypothetical protein